MGQRRAGADPGLLVLISLAPGPKHGHAMLLDVERFSGQRLGPGTLYGAIERLEADGLVIALPAEERRIPYRLTPEGAAYLARRLEVLGRVIKVGIERGEA